VPPQEVLFPIDSPSLRTRPFLKWAGGKTRLLGVLRRSIPPAFRQYVEPFLGGAALFFDLAPTNAVLSDSNGDLISCYEVVRDAPEALIQQLLRYRVSETEFYRVRALCPDDLSPVERAARFIYLNKTCYNGVYRVNKKGDFNTPFGHYKSASFFNETNLRRASECLKDAVLACRDYQAVLEHAQKGDFVYLDPPYMPVGKFSDFKRYTKEFFYEADHERLAQVFASLATKGCHVLLSNSFHPRIAELYSGYYRAKVEVPRFVNCKGEGRGNVTELLISNYAVACRIDAA
jgi:DNA adenine methylase